METIKCKVEKLLERFPQTRNSDHLLQYKYWTIYDEISSMEDWLKRATDPESIRRCRQKIQEEREDLRSIPEVQEIKDLKQMDMFNWVTRDVR